MQNIDLLRFTTRSIVAHRMRSVLTALGIGIGVTAVVLLTSIGEGVNHYVVEQFSRTIGKAAQQLGQVPSPSGRGIG